MEPREHGSELRHFLKLTSFGVLRWKRTTDLNLTFTTAMGGQFVVTAWEDKVNRYFKLESLDGKTQLLVTSAESAVVDAIFTLVKDRAFNLHKAIAQLSRLNF